MKKKTLVVSLGVVALLLSGFVYWTGEADSPNAVMGVQSQAAESGHKNGPTPPQEAYPQMPWERLVDQLAIELLERYGETIHQLQTQAKLADEREFVKGKYPEYGLELFNQAVAVAFPDRAEDILALVAAMAEYQGWLEANRLTLSQMSFQERERAIWEKRRQLFGPDAEVLWGEERRAMTAKHRAMQDVIDRLDQAHETSLDEKLFQLNHALDDIYGYGGARLALDPGTVAQTFFSLESVQDELRTLPDEERQKAINRARQQLGYGQEQIARLQERDQMRNQRWNRGKAYMAERKALEQRYTGDELERQIDALRKAYFEHEARTIGLEEKDGFFRYERRRVYGRN